MTERVVKNIHGEWRYCVVGPTYSIDFHVSSPDCAGLEIHRSVPAPYDNPRKPVANRCWLTGGKCWCDGTTLYATERLLPLFYKQTTEQFWETLEHEYKMRAPDEEADNE
jgi:hypothetical protein